MSANVTLLLIFVTLASVTAQTFQYSRGWTNGKRDQGHLRPELKELINNMDKILSPCQKNKLKYLLEGKPVTERLLIPCDILDTEEYPRALTERNLNAMMDAFY
uniref:Pro-corazonin n=1 Tax=Agrotis ipsilon TaxID=56364 RepID=CORZ_AGRIP|nr:RecName: Full=Pro-corazonin; Contains: RecName: Full=Corazonin; Flags: Precursor [Agrotis ipsilon]